MKIQKLDVRHLSLLTELFDYHDVEGMIRQCTQDIQNGVIDIFVLYDQNTLIGELHVMYRHEDVRFAIPGQRAYLFAFRVREGYQNMGYGTHLMKMVLSLLEENGYREFTIGVEDDNRQALHIYQNMGFREVILRKREEYQGDVYEYNLYLRK